MFLCSLVINLKLSVNFYRNGAVMLSQTMQVEKSISQVVGAIQQPRNALGYCTVTGSEFVEIEHSIYTLEG